MFMGTLIIIGSVLTIIFSTASNGESYNLFGIPGQGYLVEINLGQPQQKLNILVDTGSSTLAVAAVPAVEVTTYFHSDNSKTLYNKGTKVSAKYSQGGWWGKLASDLVEFPSLNGSTTVRSDIVLINLAYDFYMNGSGWQGILGLAYPAISVGKPGEEAHPWLDSLDEACGVKTSFELTLCGVRSPTNASHYGKFILLDDKSNKQNDITRAYMTPILRERWYEIGVLGVRLLKTTHNSTVTSYNRSTKHMIDSKDQSDVIPKEETCRLLNSKKSIVDSGTTNIRLPSIIFRQLVDELRNAAFLANFLFLDESFWYHGEADCWPQPQHWPLPILALDLLDAKDDHQYFTLMIPPQNYIRLMTAHNSSGTVAEYCYKFGLEEDPTDTVLGVAAMEGFEVLFNRSGGFICYTAAKCGYNVSISGPHKINVSLSKLCGLERVVNVGSVGSIKVAQWSFAVIMTVATVLVLYLLYPCLKRKCMQTLRRQSSQISLSRAALVVHES